MLTINVQKKGRVSHHRNAVLVDHAERTYERFEPHGGNESRYDDVMEREFREIFGLHGYTYIPPSSFCPSFGPQKYVKGSYYSGTCVFWSLWYLEQRLVHPDKTQSQILDELLTQFKEKGQEYAVEFIKDYIDKINQHKIYIHHKFSGSKKQHTTPKPAPKPAPKKSAKRSAPKKSVKRPVPKKSVSKKRSASKKSAKRPAPKKSVSKKRPAKKTVKRPAPKKSGSKKRPAKKSVKRSAPKKSVKRSVSKKSVSKKTTKRPAKKTGKK